jgi:hypothetical protein
VVAKRAWQLVSESIGFQVGVDYESITKLWLCNKKFGVINMITSAVYWCLWKLRNAVQFQGVAWVGMKLLWDQVMPMLQCRKVLVPVKMVDGFDNAISLLENLAWRLERIKLPLAGRNVQAHLMVEGNNSL